MFIKKWYKIGKKIEAKKLVDRYLGCVSILDMDTAEGTGFLYFYILYAVGSTIHKQTFYIPF